MQYSITNYHDDTAYHIPMNYLSYKYRFVPPFINFVCPLIPALGPPIYSLYQWVSCFCFFPPHVNKFMYCLSISDLISLSIIPSRSIHVVANYKILLFFCHWVMFLSVCVCMYEYLCIFSLSIQLLVDIGCFNILAIKNNCEMNISVHISCLISVLVFFEWIPNSGVGWSYSCSIFKFFEKPLHSFW